MNYEEASERLKNFTEQIKTTQYALKHLMYAKVARLKGNIETALVHEGWFEGLKKDILADRCEAYQVLHDILEEYELSVEV